MPIYSLHEFVRTIARMTTQKEVQTSPEDTAETLDALIIEARKMASILDTLKIRD